MSASRKWANYTNSALVLATLLLLAVIMVVIPIGWMLITALKERQQIFAWPPVYFPDPIRWENFNVVLNQLPFMRFAANSMLIALLNIVGRVLSCTLVAFSFARMR